MLDAFHLYYGDAFKSISDEYLGQLLNQYGGDFARVAAHLGMILNNSQAIAAATHAAAMGKEPPEINIQTVPTADVKPIPFVGVFFA
jgi:hypothetical protein